MTRQFATFCATFVKRSLLVAISIAILSQSGCGSSNGPTTAIENTKNDEGKEESKKQPGKITISADEPSSSSPATVPEDLTPEVIIKTNLGTLRVELNAEKAPNTVRNFLRYVDDGFYAKTLVHYVNEGMVIAGGFGPDYQPKETRTAIRHEGMNGLKNERGTIAMVRLPDYVHSATSQFFFNLKDQPAFDYKEVPKDSTTDEEVAGVAKAAGMKGGINVEDPKKQAKYYGYCVFGRIVSGTEVLDAIAKTKVGVKDGFPNTPTPPVVIESIIRAD